MLVTDIVYTPLMTPFLLAAQSAGLSVQDGFGMLIYQGAAAFKLWTGQYPEIEVGLRSRLLS
jgi:shikimate dehydrogenase